MGTFSLTYVRKLPPSIAGAHYFDLFIVRLVSHIVLALRATSWANNSMALSNFLKGQRALRRDEA
jgi:hypothetical protein